MDGDGGGAQGPKEKVDGELGSMGLHGEKVSRERRGVRVRQSTRRDQEGEFLSQFNRSLYKPVTVLSLNIPIWKMTLLMYIFRP